jgi:NAD(P)-dependent dehydrogenase (short-subunit alcohol dehydrogenase family)
MQRVALVTGASQGLGAVIAGLLARQDYDLVITARGRKRLDEAAGSLAQSGAKVTALAGDVADPQHQQELVKAAQALGRLDLLINNASVLGPSPLPPLTEHPLDALERVLAVNLIAPLALIQAALPLLKTSGGLVVNISSDAARGGYPGWGGYGSSKAALDLASLTLANELRDSGVSVVSVDPGDLRTQMQQQANPGEDISDYPSPDVTVPFWLWLFGQKPMAVSGQRYEAQEDQWELGSETG